jgi:hypothetical protein
MQAWRQAGRRQPSPGDCAGSGTVRFRSARLRDGRPVGRGAAGRIAGRFRRSLAQQWRYGRTHRVAGDRACFGTQAGAASLECHAAVMDEIVDRIRPSVEACGKAEIDGLMTALGGRLSSQDRRARRHGAAGRAADRTQFLLGRQPRGADTGRPGNWGRNRPSCWSRACPGSWRMACLDGADGLGHVEHAHRRRRYRPGDGADRREAGLGRHFAAGDRLRDHPRWR